MDVFSDDEFPNCSVRSPVRYVSPVHHQGARASALVNARALAQTETSTERRPEKPEGEVRGVTRCSRAAGAALIVSDSGGDVGDH
jgi:hypothetical protein